MQHDVLPLHVLLDIFPNEENWQIGNWQIATDTLIVNIKAPKAEFQMGVWRHHSFLYIA